MTIDTVMQAEVFRVLVIFAVSATVIFLGLYSWLTRGRAWRDRVGRPLLLAILLVLGQTTPLLISSFTLLHGTVNTVAGWTWIGFEGLIGVALAWLSVAFWRADPLRKAKP